MDKMTKKDYEVLDFICERIKEYGYPPSVREIGGAVGLSSSATVHARIKKLERLGYIVREPLKKRSMRVVNYKNAPADRDFMDVPVYGRITAGVPIEAIQENCGHFMLPLSFARNRDIFMLRVEGESMINAAILDGDYIIVQQQNSADNGDIVVAMVNGGEATVKTFYREDGHFRLQPENDTMLPIIVDEVEILGKVVGVFREI